MTFKGFDATSIAQLSQLPTFDTARYRAASDSLRAGLRQPAVDLVEALTAAFSPKLTASRRSSVSPLHADLRFADVGAPKYKDHLLLTAWHGSDKKTGPTLWLRIDSKSVGFASGFVMTPASRDRFRRAVAEARGAKLVEALAVLEQKHRRHGFELAGQRLQKVPRPWREDHPRAALLKLKGFQVRFREALPKNVGAASFAGFCEARWRELWPVHTWLVQEVY